MIERQQMQHIGTSSVNTASERKAKPSGFSVTTHANPHSRVGLGVNLLRLFLIKKLRGNIALQIGLFLVFFLVFFFF